MWDLWQIPQSKRLHLPDPHVTLEQGLNTTNLIILTWTVMHAKEYQSLLISSLNYLTWNNRYCNLFHQHSFCIEGNMAGCSWVSSRNQNTLKVHCFSNCQESAEVPLLIISNFVEWGHYTVWKKSFSWLCLNFRVCPKLEPKGVDGNLHFINLTGCLVSVITG